MDFDQTTSIGLFVVLLVIILGGTLSSPMSATTKSMVSGGLLVFGIVTFYIGIKHGEFRATH
ncbi:DUF7333 family protein [Halocatena marina]|uniref:Uncharacterized protein n=1 Tax=Halocatena marina TaxID=2934937 RepID=A0ABD5YT26_9EURY|nr:hypothetical protein [Halocatena marina]